jgi:hypothetical protein
MLRCRLSHTATPILSHDSIALDPEVLRVMQHPTAEGIIPNFPLSAAEMRRGASEWCVIVSESNHLTREGARIYSGDYAGIA